MLVGDDRRRRNEVRSPASASGIPRGVVNLSDSPIDNPVLLSFIAGRSLLLERGIAQFAQLGYTGCRLRGAYCGVRIDAQLWLQPVEHWTWQTRLGIYGSVCLLESRVWLMLARNS